MVSLSYLTNLIRKSIVDRPDMVPRKDYDDYAAYINDTYADKKQNLLQVA